MEIARKQIDTKCHCEEHYATKQSHEIATGLRPSQRLRRFRFCENFLLAL